MLLTYLKLKHSLIKHRIAKIQYLYFLIKITGLIYEKNRIDYRRFCWNR